MKQIIMIVLALSSGCATMALNTEQDTAAASLNVAYEALDASYGAWAVDYEQAAKEALQESETILEYEAALAGHHDALSSLGLAKASLVTAQGALQTWIDGGTIRTFVDAASCLFEAMARLRDVLHSIHIEIPGVLVRAIVLGSDVSLGGLCGS